jgi:hypothetical protein
MSANVERMDRKASDNKYRHRDFHNFMDYGLRYVAEAYGDEAALEYLRQFAAAYYAPLREDLRKRGAIALKEHFQRIYAAEEASDDVGFDLADGVLTMTVKRCPAVTHMRARGIEPSPLFVETSRTVCATICEGTPWTYRMERYDPATGASVEVFERKGAST